MMVSIKELNLERTNSETETIMKKMFIPVILGAVLVSGCQMNNQTGGTLLGAGAGGLLGSQFGSGKGKLVTTAIGTLGGAMIGNNVGNTLDKANQHSHVPVPKSRPIINGTQTQITTFSECLEFAPGPVRSACERGVQKRIAEKQRRDEDAAFNKGYKPKN